MNQTLSYPQIRNGGIIALLVSLVLTGLIVWLEVIPLLVLLALLIAGLAMRIFRFERVLFLGLLVLFLIPTTMYQSSVIPISLDIIQVTLLSAGLALWSILGRLWDDEPFHAGRALPFWFVLLAVLSTFSALLMGRNPGPVLNSAFRYYLFLFYFLFYDMFDRKAPAELHRQIFLFLSLLVIGIGGFVMMRQVAADYYSGIERIVSTHFNLFTFLLPLFGFQLIRSGNRWFRATALILLVLSFYIIIVSQSRIVWVVSLLQLGLLGVYYLATGTGRERTRRLVWALVFMLISLGVLVWYFSGSLALITRLQTLSPKLILMDPSLQHRIMESKALLTRLSENAIFPVFGSGMADEINFSTYGLQRYHVREIDSSYLTIIWHTGLAGLVIYLAILYRQFKNALVMIRRSIDPQVVTVGWTVLVYIAGLLVFGLTSAIMVKYRFNILWAGIWAYSEVMARRISRQDETA